MGRPRSFDESDVLDAAAAAFRVHGFAATSTEQLCEAAGVRRSSLYNTFTSKEDLFVKALERYVGVTTALQESALTDHAMSGAERLRALLDLILAEEREAAAQGHAAGCMVVGARMTPSLGEHDARVRQLLDEALDQQVALLIQAIRSGQADDTVRPEVEPRAAALTVVALISGLRVLAQAGASLAELDNVAQLTLESLLI